MAESGVKIGLEIHVQLTALKSKLFCSCPTDYRGKPPNTNICPVCLGLPGVLPVVNRKAIEYAIMVALALNCKLSNKVVFVRKHYFYPDLPKNYQISQYDGIGSTPLCRDGYLQIRVNGKNKVVRIRRINIEEDPGRLTYPTGDIATSRYSLVDYNRSGIALLEIVTEPDIHTPQEARAFLTKLVSILEHLGITDISLEGAFRVDANISIGGGGRVEVKNIGSIKDVERALSYEILRQRSIVAKGGVVKRETRHWDSSKRITVSLRVKETEEDYRYFPDPDLPPITISDELVKQVMERMPELPDHRIKRFMKQYGLDEYRATVLVMEKWLADLFESVAKLYSNYKRIADLLITDFMRWVNEFRLTPRDVKATPQVLAKLLRLLDQGVISIKIVKEILPEIISKGVDPEDYIKKKRLTRIADEEYLRNIVREIIHKNRKAALDALTNPRAINYLIGMVMKQTRGRADPSITAKLVREELARLKEEK
ncbi:MAG: Asp-tRNA(Asn)/Glu-tRNA(Gln) amidotransferase GatCAB subunit B [Thermoprotei archaeon]|nr:MAG: Asp-tRNA(Asn)/Glu-tRNA(Gln) amidotransferase GatCAB subunit B [Thermoprotei archaeon]